MKENKQKHITRFIRMVCKGKSEEELQQAEANYLRFIELAERVNNRLRREKEKNSS